MKPQTIGRAAEMIASASRQKPALIARQIRTFFQLELIVPTERSGSGRTAAALLTPMDICMARVFCAMAERGLAIPRDRTLNPFAAAQVAMLTRTAPAKASAAELKRLAKLPRPIEEAMAVVLDGGHFNLALTHYRDGRNGRTYVQGALFPEGKYSSAEADTPPTFIPEGVHLFYLNPLLAPLIAHRADLN